MEDQDIDRDDSWFGFNYRILNEVTDASVPLLERFRFLPVTVPICMNFDRVRFPITHAPPLAKRKGQPACAQKFTYVHTIDP